MGRADVYGNDGEHEGGILGVVSTSYFLLSGEKCWSLVLSGIG